MNIVFFKAFGSMCVAFHIVSLAYLKNTLFLDKNLSYDI